MRHIKSWRGITLLEAATRVEKSFAIILVAPQNKATCHPNTQHTTKNGFVGGDGQRCYLPLVTPAFKGESG